MSKCGHCQRQKGRRACPALAGVICSACCGQHRGRELACPSDCPYFVEADGSASLLAAYNAATEKLFAAMFADDDWCLAAHASLFGKGKRRVPEAWEESNFAGFMAHGFTDGTGQRYVDRYLHERGTRLKLAETKALEALRNAWFSAFEIQEIRVDEGLELRDLITGNTFFVHEKTGTHAVVKFDALLAWVTDHGGRRIFTGDNARVPRGHLDAVLKALRSALTKARKARPDLPARALTAAAVGPAHHALLRASMAQQPPRIRTMDGEEVVFCEALFDLSDVEAVTEKLAAHPDLDDDGDGAFHWMDRKGRQQLGPGALHLGIIAIQKGRLKLETQSKERLAQGKAFLAGLLGELATHRLDAVKDLEVALREHAQRPRAQPQAGIPPEVQAELLSNFLQQHLTQWIDEQLPALDGQTPREAARTKRGREKVAALLKEQEHSAQRMPGGDRVDFAAVYEKLGLRATE
ncbi:MAG: DUF2384 domain-containing protein [Deltaproteobacteria bacterium]|nr:DUF2384 domain-containing protein [Deltaproteobacteria bacterium]